MLTKKKRLVRLIFTFTLFILLIIINYILEINEKLLFSLFLVLYLGISYEVIFKTLKNIIAGKIFDENFLMLIASIGAFVIGEYPEAVAVMLFYETGELFQDYAIGKTRNSIALLMDIKAEIAIVLIDNQEIKKELEEVELGDLIIVRAGEKVPVDGMIVDGTADFDTKALTGESLPRTFQTGDNLLSGYININGVITFKAQKTYQNSAVAKILNLVENATNKKTKSERFISRFAKYYTPIVVFLAILLATFPPLFGGEWNDWFERALTFLVVSCPCALVISVPMSYFGGLGNAANHGIMFKGTNYLELINKANIFVFDKTGTLTKGRFQIQEISPDNKRQEILSLAGICESKSTHPIAQCIMEELGPVNFNQNYQVQEIAGLGMKATNGQDTILVGNAKLLKNEGITFTENELIGSVVYIAKNNTYIGFIRVMDAIRSDAQKSIIYLNNQDYKTIMLTGDSRQIALKIAEELNISDCRADLLPEDKVKELEKIIINKKVDDIVVFVGDGINDAPVLARADVGICMGGIGSDSAIEAADIVFVHDNLDAIIDAKEIAKKTIRIVKQNICFALIIKFSILILSAFAMVNMWGAVFADVGVSILAIFNSLRTLKSKKAIT